MSLPKRIAIHELGPREGFQIEKGPIATGDKVRLINALAGCGFPEVETVSFVSPKWVPQMADAEQVVAGLEKRPGTRFTAIYMNAEGIKRALATGKIDMEGYLSISASEAFSRRNTNAGIDDIFAKRLPERIALFKEFGVTVDTLCIMAAFGCNFEGDIAPDHVMGLIQRLLDLSAENGLPITMIQLADTMAWATPPAVRRLIGMIRDRWPEMRINLHLHDTRGLGLANAFAALELGVDDFDAAVGGLGGCPYAGFQGAAGNISSEDLVHFCAELGIETGVDLPQLIELAREAERIVGHDLPGKIMRGGMLQSFRRTAA